MLALFWIVLMGVWLAGLGLGAWWVWPHFERMELTGDLVFSAVWLVIGAAAWMVAAGLGWQRFFRRPSSSDR